jgi:uncharacterized repeat protein (TIGR02543 family)
MSNPFNPAPVTIRRCLAVVLAMLLAASMLTIAAVAPARAAPASTTINGVTYAVNTDASGAGASAIGYDASFGPVVVIPNTVAIDGADYTVTSIGYGAFNQKGLTSVTLPDGLVTIENSAFFDNALTSIAIPDGVVDIEVFAFYQSQLTSVSLPNSVVTIGEGAFAINQLTSLEVPPNVTTVGLGAFHSNHALTQVLFTGPAPTTITGAGVTYPSLGNAAGLTVSFPAQYLAQTSQQGYTTPEWIGYEAHPFYTVSFDTRGGPGIEPVIVSHNQTVELPAVPVRDGHTFTGWYTTPELETAFDSELPVTESLTLYAGWRSLIIGSLGSLALASAMA